MEHSFILEPSLSDLLPLKVIEDFFIESEEQFNVIIQVLDENNLLYYQSKNGEIDSKTVFDNSFSLKVEHEIKANIYFSIPETYKDIFKNLFINNVKKIFHLQYKIFLTNNFHLKMVQNSYDELKEKNEKLMEAYQALKELDIIKNNFLATISHELKTPLTSIMGYAELIQLEESLSEEGEENLERILKNAEELFQLIRQLLDISKIEAGAIRVQKERVPLKNILNNLKENLNFHIKEKNITLKENIYIDINDFYIIVDEEKIFQSLRNLLTNAIKFSNNDSIVEITIKKIFKTIESDDPDDNDFTFFGPEEREFLHIGVRDYGIGIPETQQIRIFEPFFQVDGSQTRNHGGTGLGLTIVKSFMLAHNGSYGLTSKVGEGSYFWIELPIE
ncbi:HAMP domain-containing histidine kinase [bacterium]|nr:HAMP domain-containing histidine kinase [bacterium]